MNKIKSLLISLLFFTFFFSCEEKILPYQLRDEQFVNVLADMHLSESATQHLALSIRDSMAKVYLSQILEIQEVDSILFETEYNRLKKDPNKLRFIYEKVIKRINELKLLKKKETKKEESKNKQVQKKR